jgi:hypothetical protein
MIIQNQEGLRIMTNAERQQMWKKKYNEYLQSGQNQTEWCNDNNVNLKSFYRWSKKFINTNENATFHRFVLAEEKHEQPTGISINIGKATIIISKNFDPDTLNNIIRLVGNIC